MNTATPALADALAQSDLLHDRAELESVIAAMGQRIDAALAGERAISISEPAKSNAVLKILKDNGYTIRFQASRVGPDRVIISW